MSCSIGVSNRASICLGLFLAVLGLSTGELAGQTPDKPDLAPLVVRVKALVGKYYPKAVVQSGENRIRVEFNTRKFMVHHPLLDGSFQDASEMVGPQKGGILADLELRQGLYGGMAAVPQTFNYHYFKVDLRAPYSKKLDCHLYAHLYYPQDAPREFVHAFDELLEGFDQSFRTIGK